MNSSIVRDASVHEVTVHTDWKPQQPQSNANSSIYSIVMNLWSVDCMLYSYIFEQVQCTINNWKHPFRIWINKTIPCCRCPLPMTNRRSLIQVWIILTVIMRILMYCCWFVYWLSFLFCINVKLMSKSACHSFESNEMEKISTTLFNCVQDTKDHWKICLRTRPCHINLAGGQLSYFFYLMMCIPLSIWLYEYIIYLDMDICTYGWTAYLRWILIKWFVRNNCSCSAPSYAFLYEISIKHVFGNRRPI